MWIFEKQSILWEHSFHEGVPSYLFALLIMPVGGIPLSYKHLYSDWGWGKVCLHGHWI